MFWVAYLREDTAPIKTKAFDRRTNHESGQQVLEFQISLDGKRVWVNADDCVVVKKNAKVDEFC